MDIEKVEADAKALAFETTSVMSGMLSAINPRWTRFAETWKSWSLRKKAIALVIVASFGGFVSAFGVSTLRLISGSYRSAYAYGHGQGITASDVNDRIEAAITAARASAPTRAQFNDLEAKVHQLEINLDVLGDQLSKQPAKITTGSIPKKKTKVVKSSASSWFSIP